MKIDISEICFDIDVKWCGLTYEQRNRRNNANQASGSDCSVPCLANIHYFTHYTEVIYLIIFICYLNPSEHMICAWKIYHCPFLFILFAGFGRMVDSFSGSCHGDNLSNRKLQP
jgi:hypothetical protein